MSNNKLNGKLLLLEDSINANAKNLMNFLTSDVENLKFLCTERPVEKWKNIITNSKCEYFISLSALKNAILNSSSCTVVLDSINQVAMLTNWEECLKFVEYLNKLQTVKRAYLILHNDCLVYGEKMLKHLKYVCKTHIYFKHIIPPNNFRVEITNVLVGGKITKTDNDIYFNAAENNWKIVEINKPKTSINDKKDELIHSMTSFKISVEKQAEAIKSDLVLPYTEINKNKNLVSEPDYDDWDDEDPDDDLSI